MKTYKIIVLGPSGSGKTVFLASLYKQLSAQREDFGFYLEINARQKRELVEKYRQIAKEQEWPASTDRSQNKSWTFTCCVQDDKLQKHVVIDFEYLDYAGETITDHLNEQGTEELDKAIQEADVLLCLLDGQKVLALMQDEEMGYELLQRDLPNMIPYLQNTDKPVHFVLTKWDLFLTDEHCVLQGERDPLKHVRDFLLRTDSSLRSIVHKRAKKKPVRLIPISAVGKNFARLEGNQMKKFGKNPTPLHVEIPLVCVLFDVFEAHRDHLRQKAIHVQNGPVESTSMTLRNLGAFAIGWFVRVSGRIALAFSMHSSGGLLPDLGGAVIDNFAERFDRKTEEWRNMELQELQRQKEEALAAIQDEESAFDSTLNCFNFLFRKLQDEFPSSDFDKS